ncbi:TPM domain-containing protein [Sphingomonas flavalba]|uniref:TPM domain-containing protein n=1 Tax=Sphingomonas flavalba TaxID=2559804 RepID=UPI0039E024FD
MVMDEASARRVSEAVSAAERLSNGEIVTIAADRSDSYHDVALLWAIGIALMVPAFFALVPAMLTGALDWLSGGWSVSHEPALICAALLAMMALKFLAAWLILTWRPLRLWLTPKAVKAARVRARAIACFKVGAERRTVGRTGILIYLSMEEHVAEIVADEAIHARVPPEAWGAAMAAMIDEVRAGRIADGIAAAVGHVGAILAAHFPKSADDTNELPDRLIIL